MFFMSIRTILLIDMCANVVKYVDSSFLVVLVPVLIEVEEVVTVRRFGELLQFPAFLFGWPSQTFRPVDESGNLVHLEDLVLVRRGDVLQVLGDEFRAHAILGQRQDLERERDRRLAYLDGIAHLDHA